MPRHKPRGSDLNQPIRALCATGSAIANISDAIKPAVVPPMTRTSAKTKTAVIEVIARGNIIVKS